MKTIYDVQQILKRFGIYIYTGDRIGDLELMIFEINELHEAGFIESYEYQMARLLLRKEKTQLHIKKDD